MANKTETPSLLVIGYGNSLRCDDSAGLLLAERLAACWREAGVAVQLTLTQQLMPELAEAIADASVTHVIFVDTRLAEHEGMAVRFEPLSAPVAAQQSLGHQMDPAMLLTYADRLYGRAPLACIITIPGVDFGFGDELSDGVRQVLGNSEEIGQRALIFLGVDRASGMEST